ncbi:HIT domain-containing protein [Bacillus sp. z60-18]|uniref:HIT domain-containing protein n=1 Tax=unclassified Bacillus (in: firmicutes) TaxID=185979 RepID=UPI00390C4A87
MNALIKIPQILIQSGICEDYTILSDNGEHAQQDIKHVHFHVIPRHLHEKPVFRLETNCHAAKRSSLFSVWQKIVISR